MTLQGGSQGNRHPDFTLLAFSHWLSPVEGRGCGSPADMAQSAQALGTGAGRGKVASGFAAKGNDWAQS